MQQVLVACGDVASLKKIIAALPGDEYKAIATKKGGGIAAKIASRNVPLAIVHEELEDGLAIELCHELRQLNPAPSIIFLAAQPPAEGPFDRALRFPVPGPLIRRAVKLLATSEDADDDLDRWRTFYEELQTRVAELEGKDYYQVLGARAGAPHHMLVARFDQLSMRFHPDRYRQLKGTRWGDAIHALSNKLYKSITEAWSVLSDRKLRQAYDEELGLGNLRMSSEVFTTDVGPRSLPDYATSSRSRKFLRMAQADIAKSDWASALQNLQFAASMEGDNPGIAAKIAEIEKKLG